MIQITFMDGPRASEVLVATPYLTPQDILCGLSQYRHRWETDYTQATAEEKELWEKQDLGVRCVRALAQGLTVRIADRVFQTSGIEGAYQSASDIEELVAASGQTATIESDNADGIVITLK
jgi:hypothetical protein